MPEPGLIITEDGSHSIQSQQFGVSYHSIHGAITETAHVFIKSGLEHKLKTQKDKIHLLEIGLGTGLNAFMSLLYAEKHAKSIHYTSLEAFPITEQQALQLNFPQLLDPSQVEAFQQIHKTPWEELHQLSKHFIFKKVKTEFTKYSYPQVFDLVYFDAFAPTSQPQFWEEPFLEKIYSCLKEDGILTTYCAKGSFKRALKAVGFKVESIPGPPRKREMTRAIKIS